MITPEYVRKQATMRELQILLDDRSAQEDRSPQPGKAIFAIFYGYDVKQCWDFNVFRALYDTEPWVGGERSQTAVCWMLGQRVWRSCASTAAFDKTR